MVTNSSKKALHHSHKAMHHSSMTKHHDDATTTAHISSQMAEQLEEHKGKDVNPKEAHGRAHDDHEVASTKHHEFAERKQYPEDEENHKKAAHHHHMAAQHHKESEEMTTNCNDDPTTNMKHPSKMTDHELQAHADHVHAEMGRRKAAVGGGGDDWGLIEDISPTNPATQFDPESMSMEELEKYLDNEFEGLGLYTEPGMTGGPHEHTHNQQPSIIDQLFASTNPKDRPYQEAIRNSVQVTNRERGMLLQQLTINMNPQQRQYAVKKFKDMPLEELRAMVGMFVGNVQNQGPPPIEPVFYGAAGGPIGPVNNMTPEQQQQVADDAVLSFPTINWAEGRQEQDGASAHKKSNRVS